MVRKNARQHGTPSGYKKHLDPNSDWGEPCDECRAAHNLEVTEYRDRVGRDRSQEILRRAAKRRALARLSKKFPRTYEEYLTEELQETGTETSR